MFDPKEKFRIDLDGYSMIQATYHFTPERFEVCCTANGLYDKGDLWELLEWISNNKKFTDYSVLYHVAERIVANTSANYCTVSCVMHILMMEAIVTTFKIVPL